jgi:hypothetical protein
VSGDISLSAVSSPWTLDSFGSSYILNSGSGSFQPLFTVTSGSPFCASLAGFKVAGAVAPPSNLSALGVGF